MDNITRICTTCSLQGILTTPATHVATAPSKLQWFECGTHENWEHAACMMERDNQNSIRCSLVPLEVWLKQIEP